MNAGERNQLLRILEYYGDLFDGTIGDWETDIVNMELHPDSKQFNSKYYPVSIINKEIFFQRY